MSDTIRTNYCPACKEQADRIAELEAENARLREALQKIADIDRYWRTTSRQSLATGDTHYDDVLEIGRFGKIASAALKEIDNG